MPNKAPILIILSIGLLILVGLARQISDALQATGRLDQAADQVTSLQEQNRRLKDELKRVESEEFIEEIARNKLNLAKKDETVVIIPKENIQKVLDREKPVEIEKIPNWQTWLKLFTK